MQRFACHSDAKWPKDWQKTFVRKTAIVFGATPLVFARSTTRELVGRRWKTHLSRAKIGEKGREHRNIGSLLADPQWKPNKGTQ